MISNVGIIGAGSMGTAVAQNISYNVPEVFLYARKQEIVNSINKGRNNKNYFPNLVLRPNIHAKLISADSEFSDLETIIIAVPSGEVRRLINMLNGKLEKKTIFTISKGLDYPSLKTMSEIISNELNQTRIGCISGPNFADEIAYGHTAGVTIGFSDPSIKEMASGLFKGFILDYSNDIRSVELCGALKNVYAIGVGIWDSVYCSHNEHYTFLNMCYKELCSVLKALSHDNDISSKFCCFGDFNLTANVDKSRNRTLGLMIGKKIIKTPDLESSIIFEGSKSVKGIIELGHQYNIEMPIANFVNNVLNHDHDPIISIHNLIRDFK
jgi:glycerol-3-phosphate dehydrogenase (NAD(P)+)